METNNSMPTKFNNMRLIFIGLIGSVVAVAVITLVVIMLLRGEGLVGTWVPEGGGTASFGMPDILILRSGGIGTVEGANATWRTENNQLYIYVSILGTSVYEYSVSGSTLTLYGIGRGQRYNKR